jgi:DUF1009 family protein
MKIIGLLAGIGRLPVEFARAARGMGFTVLTIALLPGCDSELSVVSDKFFDIPVGQLDTIMRKLKIEQVSEVTMLGKVTKEHMFTGKMALDNRLMKLLSSLPDRNDDTIMLAFVRELSAEGISVLDQTQLIASLMPSPGVLTKCQPTLTEFADMMFGLAMARQIGGLDIGQTVVVKNSAVLAVEAIEGTDACIKRGGQLGSDGVVVAKAAKPSQDMRFDVPGVGLETIRSMLEVRAAGLVIEAGKTLLIDREAVVKLADAHGISIVAM